MLHVLLQETASLTFDQEGCKQFQLDNFKWLMKGNIPLSQYCVLAILDYQRA
jgi:hypothetical protein